MRVASDLSLKKSPATGSSGSNLSVSFSSLNWDRDSQRLKWLQLIYKSLIFFFGCFEPKTLSMNHCRCSEGPNALSNTPDYIRLCISWLLEKLWRPRDTFSFASIFYACFQTSCREDGHRYEGKRRRSLQSSPKETERMATKKQCARKKGGGVEEVTERNRSGRSQGGKKNKKKNSR